jgi:excisionase family DNA binding protein
MKPRQTVREIGPLPAPAPSAESMAVCAMGAVKVREAGRLIGKSRSYVFALIREGKLQSFKHGEDRVVPLTAIQRYLAEVRDHHLGR